jgi:hypothetical protein
MRADDMSNRDQRIADDVGLEQSLRCKARGCPCPWSVNFGVKLCSAHALCKSPSEWPFVTQQLLDDETEQALHPRSTRPEPTATREEAVAALAEIRAGRLFKADPAKAWARRLEEAEASGKSLSRFQRDCWRKALGHVVLDAARDGAAVPARGITDALQATGDLPTEETM